jgi:hypothetical protein
MARGVAVPPYGPPIHEAIATGNLAKMKAMEKQAEKYLTQVGDVSAALSALKAEIAKAEVKSKKS